MITEFGKKLRIYRVETGLKLKDMADKLQIPSSYLSAIEMGRKTISEDFLNKLFHAYTFSKQQQIDLREAAQKTAHSIKFDLTDITNTKREMMLSFARRFNNLSEDEVRKISALLKEVE